MNKNATPVSLRELLKEVPNTTGIKLPTAKALRSSDSIILYDIEHNSSRLTVYANGFFIYTHRGYTTVQSIHKCNESIWYEFADGHKDMCSIEQFLDEPFPIRLMLEGDLRLEMNQNARHSTHQYSYDTMEAESSDLASPYSLVDEIMRSIDINELYAAIAELTDKQRDVVVKFYLDGMTQKEVAKQLGISREAVKARLESALRALHRNPRLQKNQ